MARTRAPIPAALAHTAFTSQEAYAQAVTRDQLRGPSYQQLHRGIYAPTEHSPTSWDYARIVTHACPTAALSQISAALLWGFPLPTRFLAQDPPTNFGTGAYPRRSRAHTRKTQWPSERCLPLPSPLPHAAMCRVAAASFGKRRCHCCGARADSCGLRCRRWPSKRRNAVAPLHRAPVEKAAQDHVPRTNVP